MSWLSIPLKMVMRQNNKVAYLAPWTKLYTIKRKLVNFDLLPQVLRKWSTTFNKNAAKHQKRDPWDVRANPRILRWGDDKMYTNYFFSFTKRRTESHMAYTSSLNYNRNLYIAQESNGSSYWNYILPQDSEDTRISISTWVWNDLSVLAPSAFCSAHLVIPAQDMLMRAFLVTCQINSKSSVHYCKYWPGISAWTDTHQKTWFCIH